MSGPVDRRGFIGGSDIAAILGLSPWKDALGLYLEKRGEIESPEIETRVLRRGKILEPAIGALYAAEHEVELKDGITLTMPSAPHFRAQVDALEYDEDGRLIPVEIKSASEFTRGKWGPSGSDDAPTYYCAQLHWQLLATGAPFGRIVALLGADDLRVYTIERDEAVGKYLLERAAEFWQRVQEGRPPEIDFEHPATGETLGRLFANPRATEIVQADDALRAWRDVFVEAGEKVKQYDAIREGAKLHFLAAMRDAAMIDFGDGQAFERKLVKRKGYVVTDSTYIDARLKKAPSSRAGTPALPREVEEHE